MSSNPYIGARVGFDEERVVTGAFTGVAQNLGGPLEFNPVLAIFDNQSTVEIAVSVDGGVTTWKTFSAGEAFVWDLRANSGNAPTWTIDLGTQFSVTGTGGTGSFRLSINYAK